MAGSLIIEALTPLLAVLDELGIPYFAGGSVASSVHGVARYTQDVDLIADLKLEQVDELAARLESSFYADAGQMREAIRYGRAFNVIHLANGFKIDVFPLRKDAFHEGELARSSRRVWAADPANTVEIPVASAEDTVLQKLAWYKQGGKISDRQWSDVLGVVTTQPVDREYLARWAPPLGVEDLLERLFAEARPLLPGGADE